MTSRTAFISRALIIYLCAVLLLPLFPAQAEAAKGPSKAQKKVQIQLGKPTVWSIGQAHYLLAKMRFDNRGLKTHMPTDSELNPNAANATRIQILKTLLNAEAQFSQKNAIDNQAAIRENQISLRNREEAQAALPAKKRELEERDRDLVKLDRKLREDEVRLAQMKAARDAQANLTATPPVKAPPPTKEENDLELEVELQKVDRAQRKAQRDAVATEVSNLNTAATGTVGAPAITEPTLTTTASTPVGSLAPLISKAIDKAVTTAPSIAASIALDNYIAMQYEIIAKQMTLLRDEVGPEERVIFVELPTSFYTVPCKADNHMIQLQWEVEEYLEDEDRLVSAGLQGLRTDFRAIEEQKVAYLNAPPEKRAKIDAYLKATPEDREKMLASKSIAADEIGYIDRWQPVRGEGNPRTADPADDTPHRYAVRALDIIPRQSALNVNSTYNTISQVNFLGVLKFITGLGIKVDYQRQQELYEQYLQQEVFASGYGKGAEKFGWTFAPLPGTKRVAPGVRTTYAILAVPRKASALQLKVKAITYSRNGTPNYNKDSSQLVAENTMIVRIPNEFTENFYVKEAIYTSVKKGERVGVLLKGDYFSPQIGVAINGVPLTRALSITSNETLDATGPGSAVAGVQGTYELISSHELYMTFSVTDKSIGTPTITLVTPEKTSSINFFDLKINYHDGLTSLQEISKTEPMFFDDLEVTQKLQIIDVSHHRDDPLKPPVPFIKARLDGKGLRRGAEIYVDDRRLPQLNKLLDEPKKVFINGIAQAQSPPGTTVIMARENLRDKIAESHMDEIKEKLKAQKKRLTKDEEARLKELKREQLNDDEEFYLAVKGYLKKQGIPFVAVTPGPTDEYVEQETTGAYKLYFKQPQKAKWHVKYMNNTKQGYEEKVFEVEKALPLVHRVVAHNPLPDGTNEVTLEFSTDNYLNNPITAINIESGEGTAQGPLTPRPAPLAPNVSRSYRQTFLLNPEDGTQMPRDQITVTVSRNGTTDQKVTITLPLKPRITSIENPNQDNKAQGYVDEEPAVVIRGTNLQHADKIFFGNKEAIKFGDPTSTEIHVTVPKGEHLTDIKFRKVPVRVVTDAASGKSLSSNVVFYTYIENLVPPNPAPRRRRGRGAVRVIIPTSSGSQTNPN
jgi:hypothetical protein